MSVHLRASAFVLKVSVLFGANIFQTNRMSRPPMGWQIRWPPQRPPPFNLLNQFGTNFWPGTLTILEHIVAVTLGSWLMNIFWNISFFGTSSAPFLSVCSTTLELLGEKRRFRPSFKLITGRLLVNNGRFHALIMTTHQTVSAHRCPQKSHGTFTF